MQRVGVVQQAAAILLAGQKYSAAARSPVLPENPIRVLGRLESGRMSASWDACRRVARKRAGRSAAAGRTCPAWGGPRRANSTSNLRAGLRQPGGRNDDEGHRPGGSRRPFRTPVPGQVGLRRVHRQRQVRPRPVIVREVVGQNPPKVLLVHHDDVVETVAPNAADHALHGVADALRRPALQMP